MRIPKHVALIPDGNRRWAEHSGLERHQGYNYGITPGVESLRVLKEYGVEEVTYYGFTTDNVKRPKVQVEAFTKACVEAVELIKEEGANLLVVGNTASKLFPDALRPYTTRTTFKEDPIKVNFLVNYGWEWDCSNMHTHSNNREDIRNQLMSKEVSPIQLIVRWGGMRRLSGLLPIQAVYADFYVVEALWPEFNKGQLVEALEWYNQQDVTLGG